MYMVSFIVGLVWAVDVCLALPKIRFSNEKLRAECAVELDRGSECPVNGSRPLYRWYYNVNIKLCQTFLYNGCGGNANRFINVDECQVVCIADDTLSPVVKDAAVPRLLPPFAANLEGAPRSVQNNIEPKSTQTTLPPTSTISAADEPLYEFSDEPDDMNRCDMAKHPGTPSSAAKQTAYYWNKEKFACLAFKYSGTGGTQNNFATKSDCNTACMPMDGPTCHGSVEPGTGEGNPASCQTLKCGQGYKCVQGAFFAECCPADIEAERKCPDGSSPQQLSIYEGSYMGDTCLDIDCKSPQYRCVQGRQFAKCCPINSTPSINTNSVDGRRPVIAHSNNSMAIHVPATGDVKATTEEKPKKLKNSCLMKKETGPCRAAFRAWYFDAATNNCTEFTYGGCDGNENRFDTIEECEAECRQSPGTSPTSSLAIS